MQHSKAFKYIVLPFLALLFHAVGNAQVDSVPAVTSIQADMVNMFTGKPKKYKIASIKTSGNHYFDENLLISISTLNVGDEVTIPGGDNFARAINKLWGQNYFSNVEVYITNLEGNNISVEIAVTERPRLGRFDFENISKGDKDDLKLKVGLVTGHIVTENSIRSAKEAILKFYAEKSFYNVKVYPRQEKDSSLGNAVLLIFNVDKGNKVRVENITFSGNTLEESRLKKQFKETREKSRFTLYPPADTGLYISSKKYTFDQYLKERGYLTVSKTGKVLNPYFRFHYFRSSKFNETKYNEDLDKLVDYYNSIGYRDAVIVDKYKKLNEEGNFNIHVKISEGRQYRFGNISWKGNTKYPDSLLTLIMGIRKGDIYNLELLNKRLGKGGAPEGSDIASLYMDDGYLFFRTEITETAVYNDTIDFEIKMTEGTQAVWKNVKIVGNDKTKEYVIRRELRTLPGEKFSRADLMRTVRELSQLNYFNQEKINPQVVPNPDDGTVDVTWQLEEKSSDQLELSAGWGGNIGLTGSLGVSFNNFSAKNIFKRKAWDPLPMGDGQKLSLRFQSNGTAYRSYNFSFTEPWLGGRKRNSLTFSVYDMKYSNSYNVLTGTTSNSSNPSYLETTGTSVSLGRQLKWPDDYFSMSAGLSYTLYTLKDYYIDRINLPGFNNGNSNNLNIKLAVQRSSATGSPQFPTGGSNLSLSVQFTPPYSAFNTNVAKEANPYKWIEYHKWRFNTEFFLPLSKPTGEDRKQLILKVAAKYGFLGRYNSSLQISPFERFQVGDAGLSNQYALLGYDIIAQRGYPVYQSSNPTVNPDQSSASQYFTMFNKYVLEMRYPLSLSAGSTIYGLAFFEAANGWYSTKDYNPFKLRRSVGVGMRFYLPMFGLLGFDYGLGLDRYTPGASIKDISRFTFMLGFEPE